MRRASLTRRRKVNFGASECFVTGCEPETYRSCSASGQASAHCLCLPLKKPELNDAIPLAFVMRFVVKTRAPGARPSPHSNGRSWNLKLFLVNLRHQLDACNHA